MSNPGCTRDDLQQAVDAVTAHGGKAQAARMLGLPENTLRSRYTYRIELKALRRNAKR